MSDLVERLRNAKIEYSGYGGTGLVPLWDQCIEAADEIERLLGIIEDAGNELCLKPSMQTCGDVGFRLRGVVLAAKEE